MNDYVVLGTLGAPHGVRGWLKVNSYTEQLDSIFQYPKWFLGDVRAKHFKDNVQLNVDSLTEIKPSEWRAQGKKWIVKIAGIDNPEDAKQFSGREIHVPERELPKLGSGDYYWKDLEGAVVVNSCDKNLGTVAYLMETGSNDVLVVRPTGESIDDKERLIPYIIDEVVVEIESGKASEGKDAKAIPSLIKVDWDETY